MPTDHHAIPEVIITPEIRHHHRPLLSTMTISAAVAVHLVAVALQGAGDQYALNPFSTHIVVRSCVCPANGCTGTTPTGDRSY